MVSTNENAFSSLNQRAISRQKYILSSVELFYQSDSPDFISAYFILSTIKLYYFYNRVFDTAQADIPVERRYLDRNRFGVRILWQNTGVTY